MSEGGDLIRKEFEGNYRGYVIELIVSQREDGGWNVQGHHHSTHAAGATVFEKFALQVQPEKDPNLEDARRAGMTHAQMLINREVGLEE